MTPIMGVWTREADDARGFKAFSSGIIFCARVDRDSGEILSMFLGTSDLEDGQLTEMPKAATKDWKSMVGKSNLYPVRLEGADEFFQTFSNRVEDYSRKFPLPEKIEFLNAPTEIDGSWFGEVSGNVVAYRFFGNGCSVFAQVQKNSRLITAATINVFTIDGSIITETPVYVSKAFRNRLHKGSEYRLEKIGEQVRIGGIRWSKIAPEKMEGWQRAKPIRNQR